MDLAHLGSGCCVAQRGLTDTGSVFVWHGFVISGAVRLLVCCFALRCGRISSKLDSERQPWIGVSVLPGSANPSLGGGGLMLWLFFLSVAS